MHRQCVNTAREICTFPALFLVTFRFAEFDTSVQPTCSRTLPPRKNVFPRGEGTATRRLHRGVKLCKAKSHQKQSGKCTNFTSRIYTLSVHFPVLSVFFVNNYCRCCNSDFVQLFNLVFLLWPRERDKPEGALPYTGYCYIGYRFQLILPFWS